MITKSIKYFLMAGTVCCGLSAAMVSCSDWDDHYEAGTATGGSNLTLWQQMKQNPQLSDFCQVLESTKIVRMHRKTGVSYAEMLDGGQSFTVVAPVNGTFNRDSLVRLTETFRGDSVVEKTFVLNHISRSTTSMQGEGGRMLMLNQKKISLLTADSTIDGIRLQRGNIHTRNGVLHITQRPLPYHLNLFEALCDLPQLSGIGDEMRKFNEDYFVADMSASSGIFEGVPVYVDSVVIERNRLIESLGYLNSEDSTYWVVAPTTAEWERVWNDAKKYFVYDSKVLRRDSLQRIWAARMLMRDAIFNMSDQRSVQDSLISVPYLNWRKSYLPGRPLLHSFAKPFQTGGILSAATPITCSNGTLYQVDKWPFDPTQTYLQPLWTEGESTWLMTTYKECTYNVRRQVADSISQSSYLQIVPLKGTSNWEATFRIDNTLSGAYDICAVILPQSVAGLPNGKPCKFKAAVNYIDEDGNEQSFNCGNTQFRSDPTRVDTVVVAENFSFPTCNYGQDDIKVTVKLQCSILARENVNFSREMYLDCIYLRPRTSNTEE